MCRRFMGQWRSEKLNGIQVLCGGGFQFNKASDLNMNALQPRSIVKLTQFKIICHSTQNYSFLSREVYGHGRTHGLLGSLRPQHFGLLNHQQATPESLTVPQLMLCIKCGRGVLNCVANVIQPARGFSFLISRDASRSPMFSVGKEAWFCLISWTDDIYRFLD